MKEALKAVGVCLIICGIAAVMGIFAFAPAGFVANTLNLASYKFFAPKYEDARRETFEHSKAYRDGNAQELRSMQLEWAQATEKQKQAMASVISHRFAGVPLDGLPADARSFLNEVNAAQFNAPEMK